MDTGDFNNVQLLALCVAVLIFAFFSRRSLRNPECHGFYRFFAFITNSALVIVNAPFWYIDIFSTPQLFSWLLLACSILFVFRGLYLLRKRGGHRGNQVNAENFGFENTSRLVTTDIYNYIRHPMYSALLLLSWGALLKHISLYGIALAVAAAVFLLLTALIEERENIAYFGEVYRDYIRRSKRFIPGLF